MITCARHNNKYTYYFDYLLDMYFYYWNINYHLSYQIFYSYIFSSILRIILIYSVDWLCYHFLPLTPCFQLPYYLLLYFNWYTSYLIKIDSNNLNYNSLNLNLWEVSKKLIILQSWDCSNITLFSLFFIF